MGMPLPALNRCTRATSYSLARAGVSPWSRQTFAVVPPMSNASARFRPACFFTCWPMMTPPRTGNCAAVSAEATPPLDSMTRSCPFRPASASRRIRLAK